MPWLDGALHDRSIVPFDLADRGLLLGDGVFDTSLVLAGRMVWREAHVARLVSSCLTLGFTIDPARIDVAIDAVVADAAKDAHAREQVNGSLRVTVTRGCGPRGVAPPSDAKPTLFATLAPLRVEALFAPVALQVSTIRRNQTSPASQVKSLAYIDSVLAMRDAMAAGCDDALFLNTRDYVACTAIGNVFAIFGDQLVTPPLTDGVIAGTARGIVLRTADELGLEAIERTLVLAEIEKADAAVVTNSLRLVAPVTRIGKVHLGSSASRRAQAIVAQVAALIRAETGVDPRKLT